MKKVSILAALSLISPFLIVIDRASAQGPPAVQNSVPPISAIAQRIDQSSLSQASANDSQLTEEQVRSRFDQLILAIQNQNIDAIVSFYAPDATIEATVNMASGPQVIRLRGRQQIRDILELAYPQMKMTAVSYSNLSILIAPDRKTATLTCTLTQSAIARGQALQSNAQQKLVFTLTNNEILVIEDKSTEMAQSPIIPSGR